ncbi:tetratricopeptide repeat protein [Granulicella sp. 5B5]|uniref:tetratricopeptide repeat protein n=1 Tax=Granulicella sp. 5B5 TaxID=1617967 RepID=UPI0015F6469D|nr:tetratricopeptide repeat protein [Granulicella sp. 5B5]QMV18672.1 tetratricopeptide repeat protein [Granulicella sp. 5B5]
MFSSKTKRLAAAAAIATLIAAAAFLWLRPHGSSATPATVHAAAYADASTCIQCHQGEAAGYDRTGMAHAFAVATAANTVQSPAPGTQFFHPASATYYSMTQHDGRFYQRRWQLGYNAKPANIEELTIDYVMGSGNHVRTYLHREDDGTLIELPLAWYAESGGHWGMNPGFDNDHPMTRRLIAYECMFCHNAYPEVPATAHRDLSANPVYTGTLPTGIDCQRCHGPGAEHVKLARTKGESMQAIRASILNPSSLSNARQMQVCEQCHLETTSSNLPDRIRHYDREPFSYEAGQPLEDFNAYFARDPAKGNTANFEIVNGPYRLRQSQCYLQSKGALTCETCHDPHDLHKGPSSTAYYTAICLNCHAKTLDTHVAAHLHPATQNCVSCHMPKRRTEDVVHAIMTDHLIQRNAPPAQRLLAARQEIPDTPANAYHGPVRRYLLDGEKPTAVDALYDAAAQLVDSSNLDEGIPALSQLLQQKHPSQPSFYIELGDAMRHNKDLTGAIAAYRQAVQLDPQSSRGLRRLGVALGENGSTAEALSTLQTAINLEPRNATLWYERALIEAKSGDLDKAIADLRQSTAIKPDFADAQNNLGSMLAQSGDANGAEAALRSAMTTNPYDGGIRSNLARVLAGEGNWNEAAFQLQRAAALEPDSATVHQDYAVALLQLKRVPDAQREAEAAIKANPTSAAPHDLLGQILSVRNQSAQARKEFEAALQLNPHFAPAELDLAETMLEQNQLQPAIPLLQDAAQSTNPAIATQARQLLQQLNAPHP